MLTKAAGPILRRRHLSWTSGGKYNPVNWFYTPPVDSVTIPGGESLLAPPIDMDSAMASVGPIVDSNAAQILVEQMSKLSYALPEQQSFQYITAALLDKEFTDLGIMGIISYINPMTYIGW